MTGKRLASIGISILAFVALTAISVLIFREMRERDRLESRNDAERTMNILLAGLRDHEDFGSAIENTELLSSKVVGVAAYAESGERIYAWGATPETWTAPIPKEDRAYSAVRQYVDKPANDSIVLLFRPFRAGPPPPMGREGAMGSVHERERRAPSGFLFTTLRRAEIMYLEIKEPVYWRNGRIESILFPIIEAALAALIIFIRTLLARNAEYRRRIEEQKNLVVLGTAASTLAHEIKNPLLSIRLQTRILEKTSLPGAQREIGIINDEVERLSALSHRVGDYLRDPAGNPRSFDPSEIALEVGMRLCGRNILRTSGPPPPRVDMDPERLRSVLENLVRNALEAGGPEEGVSIEAGAEAGAARIDVLDRGSGLPSELAGKVFDPFFTTKSRGTGIGLSVCKRFVAAAGGSIALENRRGGGCRARVILPGSEASA
ncbi:MAG: HAMP domain-containing sensor histidine kinase [Rectinemataceae bacterium]|jgi:two-component system sensor histidine kinase HydH